MILYFLITSFASKLNAEVLAGWEDLPPARLTPPPVCFEFASHPPISHRRVAELANRHGGHVLIGIDPGDPWSVEEKTKVKEFEKITAQTKAQRHVYLEGPGGPTGDGEEPDKDELKRMRYGAFLAAKRLKIPINDTNWRKLWSDGLWLEYTKIQILDYNKRGYHTFEIDNLTQYKPIGDNRDPSGLIKFYGDLFAWMSENNVMMDLVPKNLSPKQIRALDNSNLDKKFIAPYAITEEGYDKELKEATREYKKMGVYLLRSGDTHNYAISTKSKPGCH